MWMQWRVLWKKLWKRYIKFETTFLCNSYQKIFPDTLFSKSIFIALFTEPDCSGKTINNSTHAPNREIIVKKGRNKSFEFTLPRDRTLYACYIFRPNESYSYLLTDDNETGGTCISFDSNHDLEYNINSSLSRLE